MTTPGWTSAVYEELRQMAGALLSGERQGHTLQPTALTNEVWLRLLDSRNAESLDEAEFRGLAAQAMRRILTDHSRRRAALKRGGGSRRTTLAGKALPLAPQEFALDLDAALVALQAFDPELVRIVELRFYSDLPVEQIGQVLGISTRTVKRRWRFASAWLKHHMTKEL